MRKLIICNNGSWLLMSNCLCMWFDVQLEYMRQHGMLGAQHRHKSTEVSRYMEALVRSGVTLKNSNNKDAKPTAAK